MSRHVIRTSDRLFFKDCRRKWDWTSKTRRNLEPNRIQPPLALGTAVHKGLQVYYEPSTWTMDREVIGVLALKAFAECLFAEYQSPFMEITPEIQAELDEAYNLGLGMLKHYFKWSPTVDKYIIPVYTEIEFEVPLKHIDDSPFLCDCHGWECVYQGRIDVLVQDSDGHYWIIDFKTTKQFNEADAEFLELDEQCGSYCWALQEKLGIQVQGVLYRQLKKALPHPPEELKRGGLSVNKQQNTTYEMYVDEINKRGLDYNDYAGILNHLQYQGNKFFKQIQVTRSRPSLRNLGKQILLETIDMVNPELPIYPRPDKMQCLYRCSFRGPCLAANDDADAEFILETNYHVRPEGKEPALEGGE